jgi:superoxide dismutase, Fe-Mn family
VKGTWDLLRNLHRIPPDIRPAVRNNGGRHLNHSLFWSLIGPPGQHAPTGPLLDAVTDNLGSLAALQSKVHAVASAHFASGWVFLVAGRQLAGSCSLV